MTGTATDHAALQTHVCTKAQKKRLERRFKDANDLLRIVIVRDMWLTGFDAPCCHTMYVDKPIARPQPHASHRPREPRLQGPTRRARVSRP